MRRLAGVVLLVCVSGGCRYGTRVEDFSAAHDPGGITVGIETAQRQFRGELIEVRGDGIVLRVGGQVWFMEYGAIESSRFDGVPGDFGMRSGRTPDAGARGELSLLARFPQRLTPIQLNELLGIYGQTRLQTLGP